MASNGYNYPLDLLMIIILICSLSKFSPSKYVHDSISKSVYSIGVMFALSYLWPTFFWDQDIMHTIRAMTGILPLLVFFVYNYYRIDSQSIIKAIIILGIIYIILFYIGLATFPNNLFGYSAYFEDHAEQDIEERGVVRLNLPGADLIPLLIFAVITLFEKNKKWYILLIPLFIVLVMRGTRTPLFVAVIVAFGYFVQRIKNKLAAVIIIIITYFGLSYGYDYLLESNSDDVLTHYVQLTDQQNKANSEGETNIRIRMLDYYFSQFNNNPLLNVIGNGACGNVGDYAKAVTDATDQGYCYNDSLFSQLYLWFGYVGLFLYFSLFYRVIKTKVADNAKYAKLYVIYVFLIAPTNVQLLAIAPILFATSLYVVQKGAIGELKLKEIFA